ncbi:Pentatricopeptide repeat-containing protein [Durusdinium trenchii]|uniref:Chloroplastic n=1 Tax=Durusdinium trenchii TaxID=1381693 RepID=A0ABP0QAN0_9DINO
MELVQVVGIRDLFGDGSVIERIHDDGEEYGISPKAGDELQINYELSFSGALHTQPSPFWALGRMVSHAANGVLCSKAIQKSIETFKLNSCGTLVCRSEYIRKEGDGGFEITEDVLIKIQLLQIYEFEDCGKKAFWEEGLVLKKAIQPQRCRLCPGFDGTWCKVKLLSAKLAEEELVQEEEEIETTVGKGELCSGPCHDLTLLTPGKPDLKAGPVPEGASGPIVFKLEMVDFGSPGPEEGPSENLLLLNLAKDVKAKGSEHFKLGRFRLAQERYSRVIQLLPKYRKPLGATTNTEVFTEWVEKKTAEELKHSSRLNLAACVPRNRSGRVRREEEGKRARPPGPRSECDPDHISYVAGLMWHICHPTNHGEGVNVGIEWQSHVHGRVYCAFSRAVGRPCAYYHASDQC